MAEPPFWAQQQLGAKAMPYPFPDMCVDKLLASHVFEHITPSASIAVFDEIWRIMKHSGQALIVVPHGDSYGFRQDPTHIAMFNEATWAYLDPTHESQLYLVYRPKPWKVARMHSSPNHSIEVILEPRKLPDGSPIDIHVEQAKKVKAKQARRTR